MSQGKSVRLENFKALLDDFGQLPSRAARPPTFMEIAGYPHYENACSNILAFFMDPVEPHGLGTLVLDALASTTGIATVDEGVGSSISVEREVGIDSGNRIDLLIESDTRVILLENKIYASVSNPLGEYANYLERLVRDGLAKHKILLTVSPTQESSDWDFINLTYEEFVGEMRSLLGRYVSSADTRYLTIFLDFLNTLENLRRGSRINQKFLKLLAERNEEVKHLLRELEQPNNDLEQSDKVQHFLDELKQFRDDLRKKVRELGALIECEKHQNVKQDFYREKTDLYDDLFHNVRISQDLLVSIDTGVHSRGWDMGIWARKGDPSKLRSLLQDLDITFEKEEQEKQARKFLLPHRFAYDANPDRIRSVLQEVIDKLATSKEREVKP